MAYYLTAPNGKELAYSSKEKALSAMRKALAKYPDWKQSDFVLEEDDVAASAPSGKPYAPPKELVSQNRRENAKANYPALSALFPRVLDKMTGSAPPKLSEVMLGAAADLGTSPFRGIRGAVNTSLGLVPYVNMGGLEEGVKAIASYGSDSFGDMMTSPGASLAYMTAPISAPAAIGSRIAALPSALRIGSQLGGSVVRGGLESAGSALIDNAVDDMNYDVSSQGIVGGLLSGGLSMASKGIGSASKSNLFRKAIQGNKTVQQNIADAAKASGMSERDYVSRIVTEGYLTPAGSWSGASNRIRDEIMQKADGIGTVLKGETATLPKDALVRTAKKGAGELLTGGKVLGDQFKEVLGVIPDVVENKVYSTVRQKNMLDALGGDVSKLEELQGIMLGKNPSVNKATTAAAKEFLDSKYLPTPYDLWKARQTLGQKTDFKGLKRAAMANAPFENSHLAQSIVYDAINRSMKDNLVAPPLMGTLPGPGGTAGRFMSEKASQALTDYDKFVRTHIPLEELADHAASRYERNNAMGLNTMIPTAASIGGSLSSGGDVFKALTGAAPIAGLSFLANKAPSPPVIGILADNFARNSKKAPIVKSATRRGAVSTISKEKETERKASMLGKGGVLPLAYSDPLYYAASVADLR